MVKLKINLQQLIFWWHLCSGGYIAKDSFAGHTFLLAFVTTTKVLLTFLSCHMLDQKEQQQQKNQDKEYLLRIGFYYRRVFVC